MPYRLVSFSGDQTFELPHGRSLVVGRGVTSDIAIYDPTISRRHAELIVESRWGPGQGSGELQRDLHQRQPGSPADGSRPTTPSPSARCCFS